jgi:NaMN:DMB phosphoribosyltransferase
MAAVLALVNSLNQDVLDNLIIGTTRWILNDRNSDINYLVSNIADIPVLAADLNFSQSKYDGLKAYEAGVVKEGVGCGGASIAAMLKSNGRISKINLIEEIEKNYAKLVS